MPATPTSAAPNLPPAVLSGLPPALRGELLQCLNAIVRNYREGRWEPSELNGGKLCEVAYAILRGHVDGKFPTKASKPQNMVDACLALAKEPPTKFPRSVRIQIPRMLLALYEIRNNRGVGHVGGDVDPNLMDATAVVSLAKWIVAELIRLFHAVSTDAAQKLVDAVIEHNLPIIWNVGDTVRVLKPAMPAKERALLLLYHARDWVGEGKLREWVEYANPTMFRDLLAKCHKEKLLEYDPKGKRAILSPAGQRYVETRVPLEV